MAIPLISHKTPASGSPKLVSRNPEVLSSVLPEGLKAGSPASSAKWVFPQVSLEQKATSPSLVPLAKDVSISKLRQGSSKTLNHSEKYSSAVPGDWPCRKLPRNPGIPCPESDGLGASKGTVCKVDRLDFKDGGSRPSSLADHEAKTCKSKELPNEEDTSTSPKAQPSCQKDHPRVKLSHCSQGPFSSHRPRTLTNRIGVLTTQVLPVSLNLDLDPEAAPEPSAGLVFFPAPPTNRKPAGNASSSTRRVRLIQPETLR
nr:PREDICTED: uncharacterized protein LOC102350894 [Latimeria chalumnae]|eukprot:XP_014346201.1 PREDICTED: uncharacterized protein LOC102350894 [Latimeria chalumnae]